jgi:O-antigen/teichoic acid export membrane protein
MQIVNHFLDIQKALPTSIYNFVFYGEKRTIALKKNIIGAFFLKSLDAIIGFVRVPLIISFLSVSEYGIWLTLSSVIGWFAFFDIGLSNGLKTRLSGALARKEYDLAKKYISTAYITIAIIICSVFIIFLLIFPFLNWIKILNVPAGTGSRISQFVFVFVTLFTIQFVANIIGTVLTADQKPALASSIGTLSSIIYLLFLIILKLYTNGSLLLLTLACNGTSVVVFILASLFFYKRGYANISPSFKYVDFKHFLDLASLGIKFFFIQISAIIMFSTDNIIITQLYTPTDVASYGVALKFMGIPLMFFSMITWPLWAAYSDAYTINDFDWIKKTVKKLMSFWSVVILAVLFFLIISDIFYKFWLMGEIHVPFLLSCFMGIYSILAAWNQIFVFFLNGTGKIKLQFYMSFLITVINIPLSIYFAKGFNLGPAGVILATNVCIFIGSVLAPMQYYKIIDGRAKGIWNG